MFNGLADSTAQSKVTGVVKPVKSTIKRPGPSVKPAKLDTQRTKAFSRKVVIPTARADDGGTLDSVFSLYDVFCPGEE